MMVLKMMMSIGVTRTAAVTLSWVESDTLPDHFCKMCCRAWLCFFLYFYIFVFYENILSSETFMTIVHFKIYLKGGNHKIFFFCLLTNVQCSCQRIKFAKLAEWLGLVRIHIDQVSLCFGGLQIKLIKAKLKCFWFRCLLSLQLTAAQTN